MEGGSLRLKVQELERAEILRALRAAGWVKAKAARELGISERMLDYRLKKYKLTIRKEVVAQGEEKVV